MAAMKCLVQNHKNFSLIPQKLKFKKSGAAAACTCNLDTGEVETGRSLGLSVSHTKQWVSSLATEMTRRRPWARHSYQAATPEKLSSCDHGYVLTIFVREQTKHLYNLVQPKSLSLRMEFVPMMGTRGECCYLQEKQEDILHNTMPLTG